MAIIFTRFEPGFAGGSLGPAKGTQARVFSWILGVLTAIFKARKKASCLFSPVVSRILGLRPLEHTGLVRICPEVNESGRIYAYWYCEMVQ